MRFTTGAPRRSCPAHSGLKKSPRVRRNKDVSCRRAILEPLKLSRPLARLLHDPERRRVTTDRAPCRARRCRHPTFAPTVFFLATARGRRPFRGLPPSDITGPPNTSAGNALRPSPAFLLLPPHAASPHFESCRRAILEPLKLSGP